MSRVRRYFTVVGLFFFGLTLSAQSLNPLYPDRGFFVDPIDGEFDVTGWLVSKTGFLPMPIIITEPALDYGGGIALLYFHAQPERIEKGISPDISGAAFFLTGNKTIGGGAFHLGYWRDDRIRFMAGVARSSLNIGLFLPLPSNPALDFNFNGWVGAVDTSFRIGKTPLWIGPRIAGVWADTTATSDLGIEIDGIQTRFLAVGGAFSWDTRDTVFTPSLGGRGDIRILYAFPFGDTWNNGYWPISMSLIQYYPSASWLVVGVRTMYNTALGQVPVYARPGVMMRGVPAGTVQGHHTIQFEPEFRVHVSQRWDLVAFGGVGLALQNSLLSELDKILPEDLFPTISGLMNTQFVYAGGMGFRYRISRPMGMSYGLDLAFSNKGWALSMVFGSSW